MNRDELLKALSEEEKLSLLVGKDMWHTHDLPTHGIKSIKTSDGPHGLRVERSKKKAPFNESEIFTCFPTASAIARSWNPALIEAAGEVIGSEAAYAKVNLVLGPGINIKRNPLCGRNFEYFSEDPYLTGKLGAAYVRGIQKNGTGACVKHFAANSREYRRMSMNAVIDERALREIYLTPFEIVVKESAPEAVMTAYNRINGEYAGESRHLIKDILREEWQYDGVVVSDWGGTNNRAAALMAGADLEMPSSILGVEELENGRSGGSCDIAAVENSVRRILKLENNTSKPGKAGANSISPDYNAQKAMQCAEESIVLLKNEHALPLNEYDPIALFGELFTETPVQGGGSSRVNPSTEESLLTAIGKTNLNSVGFDKAYDLKNKKYKNLAKNAEVMRTKAGIAVIALGYPDFYESEGFDRADMKLPFSQISAYKTVRSLFKKVIVILFSGGPVELGEVSDCDGLVYAGLNGQKSAAALVKVILGTVNPSGKLTETFPLKYEEVPSYENFGNTFQDEYRESIFVGYRYYEKAKVNVAYPFGYGLSYTEFAYFNAHADKNGVTFNIKNVGDTDGAEVCQMYISFSDSHVYRPVKELKGFVKVMLKAGEQKSVFIPFDDKTFRYFSTETGKFEREAGNYKIYIAASSDDIRLSVPILMSGTAKIKQVNDSPSYVSGSVRNVRKEEFERIYGSKINDEDYDFYKKKRINITEHTTLSDLKYSKGLFGRTMARFATKKLKRAKKAHDYKKFGVYSMFADLPLGTAARFAGFNSYKKEGLLMLVGGKFFKGLKMILRKQKGNR